MWSTKEYPLVRDDGVPFADSKRRGDAKRAELGAVRKMMKTIGAFLQKRGDWAWYKQLLNLTGWKSEGPLGRVCFKCLANNSTFPFTDPSLQALWRATMLTHQVFLQLCHIKGLYISAFFDIIGMKLDYVDLDLMHVTDLGTNLYLYGNIFMELFFEMGGTVSNPGRVLGELMTLIKSAAKAIKQDRPPINAMTMGMLQAKSQNPPKLKIKAAESRYMCPVLRHILTHFFKVESEHQQMRLACVVALDDMYTAMRKPDAQFDGGRVASLIRRHLILYAELGAESLRSLRHQTTGWISYRWYPKHHLMSHFEGQIATSGSPAQSWCYYDESTIGLCVGVAEACHPKTLHRLIIDKYRI